jgi:hypothetical protein
VVHLGKDVVGNRWRERPRSLRVSTNNKIHEQLHLGGFHRARRNVTRKCHSGSLGPEVSQIA